MGPDLLSWNDALQISDPALIRGILLVDEKEKTGKEMNLCVLHKYFQLNRFCKYPSIVAVCVNIPALLQPEMFA